MRGAVATSENSENYEQQLELEKKKLVLNVTSVSLLFCLSLSFICFAGGTVP